MKDHIRNLTLKMIDGRVSYQIYALFALCSILGLFFGDGFGVLKAMMFAVGYLVLYLKGRALFMKREKLARKKPGYDR